MRIPPFRTEPSFHHRPWGGRLMAERLHKKIPDGLIGESWEVSAHPIGPSIAADGPFAGMSLAEITAAAGPALLGRKVWEERGREFPVLVKLIDVNSLVSVQVHPDDSQARRLEGFPRGKTEAWYVIARAPSARFRLGLVPGVTAQSLRAALETGTAEELLAAPEVSAGDCLFIPPGMVHAVGDGVLMLEVQQSCDITYRVYDWDRVDGEDRRRELHVEKALQVIDFSARPRVHRPARRKDCLNRILTCSHFEMDEAVVQSRLALPARPACLTGTVVGGSCRLASADAVLELPMGASFVLPAGTAADLAADNGDGAADNGAAGDGPATVILTTVL